MYCRASIRNNGTYSDKITIKVTPPPTISLQISRGAGNGNNYINVDWHASNAVSCQSSGEGASVLGWTAGPQTYSYWTYNRYTVNTNTLNRLPGKKFILTCQ